VIRIALQIPGVNVKDVKLKDVLVNAQICLCFGGEPGTIQAPSVFRIEPQYHQKFIEYDTQRMEGERARQPEEGGGAEIV
jgi:hypothetical protein